MKIAYSDADILKARRAIVETIRWAKEVAADVGHWPTREEVDARLEQDKIPRRLFGAIRRGLRLVMNIYDPVDLHREAQRDKRRKK